jgi:hypothetical protein
MFARGVTHFMGGDVKQKITAMSSTIPGALHPVAPASGNTTTQGVLAPRFGPGQNPSAPAVPPAPPPLPPVKAIGYIIGNNRVIVKLSDGRTLHDNQVARITEWEVVGADGQVYEISDDYGHGTPPPTVKTPPIVTPATVTLGNLTPAPAENPPKSVPGPVPGPPARPKR